MSRSLVVQNPSIFGPSNETLNPISCFRGAGKMAAICRDLKLCFYPDIGVRLMQGRCKISKIPVYLLLNK